MKKNLLAIVFASFLTLSLGACSCSGNNGGGSSSGTPSGSTSTPEEHTHTFASEWSSDATHHWHAATCGHDVVSDKAEHTLDEHGFCKVCGTFAGRDFVATTDNQIVNVGFTAVTGKTDYVRIKVKAGCTYDFDYSDGAMDYFDSGTDCWYKDTSDGKYKELYPSTKIEIPAASDGFVYFTAVFAKSGSFTFSFKLKVICDHSAGKDAWGFCLNEQCRDYLGHEGHYENDPVNVSALAAGQKDYYAIDLYNTGVQHVFMMSGDAGTITSIGYMNANKQMVTITDSILSNGGQYYLPENFMVVAKYQRLYVALNNTSGSAFNGKMAVGTISYDGFDFVNGFKRFHGAYIDFFGVTYDIDPFDVYQYHFDEPTPGDYYYYSFTFPATVGFCYELECDGFTPTNVLMYKVTDGEKSYATRVEGAFEANDTKMYGLVVTDTPIDENNSICLFEGHFPDDEDVYKGFYCLHHSNPVWTGEPTLTVKAIDGSPTYRNVTLNPGEKNYFRFDVENVTHLYKMNPSDGTNLKFNVYAWNGSQMVEIEEEEDADSWTYYLPQASIIGDEEDSYYFITIENTSEEDVKNFTFYVSEEHHYNEFGICWLDGEFRPTDSRVVTQSEVTNHTAINFSIGSDDKMYLKVPMTSGHSFRLEFDDTLGLAENDQIRFAAVMGDDYDPYEIEYDESGDGYINATMPAGFDDYLYVLVAPTAAISNPAFKFYENDHHYNYFGRCDCYDYNGVTLAFDMPLTGQPALAPGEVLKFRFEADEAYTRYFIKFEDQIEKDDLRVVYYTGTGGSVELTNDIEQSDTTFIIHFNDYYDCDDGYVYIRLQNSTLSSYVINGLVFDNQLE